jgi:excisionase family DNA binding protein
MPSRRVDPASDRPRYLRTSQVAELLSVSRETVTRWAAAGKLPVMKTLGGHRRFPEAEILALLEKLTHTSEWDTRRLHP